MEKRGKANYHVDGDETPRTTVPQPREQPAQNGGRTEGYGRMWSIKTDNCRLSNMLDHIDQSNNLAKVTQLIRKSQDLTPSLCLTPCPLRPLPLCSHKFEVEPELHHLIAKKPKQHHSTS